MNKINREPVGKQGQDRKITIHVTSPSLVYMLRKEMIVDRPDVTVYGTMQLFREFPSRVDHVLRARHNIPESWSGWAEIWLPEDLDDDVRYRGYPLSPDEIREATRFLVSYVPWKL